jgi:hypothetical protein
MFDIIIKSNDKIVSLRHVRGLKDAEPLAKDFPLQEDEVNELNNIYDKNVSEPEFTRLVSKLPQEDIENTRLLQVLYAIRKNIPTAARKIVQGLSAGNLNEEEKANFIANRLLEYNKETIDKGKPTERLVFSPGIFKARVESLAHLYPDSKTEVIGRSAEVFKDEMQKQGSNLSNLELMDDKKAMLIEKVKNGVADSN